MVCNGSPPANAGPQLGWDCGWPHGSPLAPGCRQGRSQRREECSQQPPRRACETGERLAVFGDALRLGGKKEVPVERMPVTCCVAVRIVAARLQQAAPAVCLPVTSIVLGWGCPTFGTSHPHIIAVAGGRSRARGAAGDPGARCSSAGSRRAAERRGGRCRGGGGGLFGARGRPEHHFGGARCMRGECCVIVCGRLWGDHSPPTPALGCLAASPAVCHVLDTSGKMGASRSSPYVHVDGRRRAA